MFVKFKQFIFQKLHPLMNSDLSKTKIEAVTCQKCHFYGIPVVKSTNFLVSAMNNYTFLKRSMHELNDKTG